MCADPEFTAALLEMRGAVLDHRLDELMRELQEADDGRADEIAGDISETATEIDAVRSQRQRLEQRVILEANAAMVDHTRHCWHDVGLREPACCWCGLLPSEAGVQLDLDDQQAKGAA